MSASSRKANFNAGPAAMPESVLRSLQDDLLDYQNSGLSVLEMSHRSPAFAEIAAAAESNVRLLLAIPDNYQVLFLQGGATAQFGLLVQNLDHAGHIAIANTGHWSAKAISIAGSMTRVSEVCCLQSRPNLSIPPVDDWQLPKDVSYLHVCDNETINGVTYSDALVRSVSDVTAALGIPLIADMSSSLFSRPVDISRYGLIYASAQKNFGLAGLTMVIVRDDLLSTSRTRNVMPPVFSYAAMSDTGSMLNTPPTFAWYAAGLVFQWLREKGGLAVMQKENQAQAQRLYRCIDLHDIYINGVATDNRSIMNVPFQLPDNSMLSAFLEAAAAAGMIGLKGHKSVGGVRASIYNAASNDAVDSLIELMDHFARQTA